MSEETIFTTIFTLAEAEALYRRLSALAEEAHQRYIAAIDAACDLGPDPETGGLRQDAQAEINRLWAEYQQAEQERLRAHALLDTMKARALGVSPDEDAEPVPVVMGVLYEA